MASIACASGMAAIMNAILNIVRSGDEIVSSASLYGGSIDPFGYIQEFGIKTRYVKNNDWKAIEERSTNIPACLCRDHLAIPVWM